MESDIVALYSVYNDNNLFEESLKSVQGFADEIIVLDGAWSQTPGAKESTTSTDGTLETAEEYADKVITREMPWAGESTARQRLLQEVSEGDWAFRIDADEIVSDFDREPLEREVDVVLPLFRTRDRDGNVTEHFKHAFFKQQPGLHYSKQDSTKIGTESITKYTDDESVTEKIVIEHFRYNRSDERLKTREGYRDVIRHGNAI